jgi:aminoglycoside phosphotransferase (APT) family kinase protein
MRVAPIQPTSKRLLEVLRTTLSVLGASAGPNEKRLLTSADLIAQELLLREQTEFFQRRYDEALALLQRGAEVIPELRSFQSALPGRPREHDPYEVASRAVQGVLGVLSDCVNALRGNGSDAALRFIADAVAFERTLHGRYASQSHALAQAVITPLEDRLRAYFAEQFEDLEFVAVRQIPGGYTKTTLLVTARDRSGAEVPLVIRAEKSPSQLRFDASNVRNEIQIIRIVEAAGVPVAHPIHVEERRDILGHPFMITTRATGRNYGVHTGGSVIPRAVVRSMAETLAKIHRVPLASLRGSPLDNWFQYRALVDNTRELVRRWQTQSWLAQADASPAWTRLVNWLWDNAPNEAVEPTLLHVDYGPHNILAEDDGVTAVLDWETCRIGDPAEDVAYLIQTTDGSVAPEEILEWYTRAGGAPISTYRLRYFDVITLLKFTAGTLAAAAMVEHDRDASILHAEGAILWWAHLADIEPRIQRAEAAKATSTQATR